MENLGGFKVSGVIPKKEIKPGDRIEESDITPEEHEMEEVGSPDKEEREKTTHSCPRCGWDIRNTIIEEITEENTREFVRSLFSSGKKRYSKEFSIAGGQITFEFRTIRPSEMEVIGKQIRFDSNEKNPNRKVFTDADRFSYYMRYRLVASLSSYNSSDEKRDFPTLEEAGENQDTENPTILPTLWAKLSLGEQEFFLLGEYLLQFDNEVGILTNRVRQPDFTMPTVG
jgi:hypothetical protein